MQKDVIIIGGGIIGVCTAYYLQTQGIRSLILEADEVCSGASKGNACLLATNHVIPLASPGAISKGLRWMLKPDSPFYVQPRLSLELAKWLWLFWKNATHLKVQQSAPVLATMLQNNLQLVHDLCKQKVIDFPFWNLGFTDLYNTQKEFSAGQKEAELIESLGIPTQILGAKDLTKLDIALENSPAVGAIHYPEDCHLEPEVYVKQLAEYVQQNGSELKTHCRVLGFETERKKITQVKTTQGNFESENIVIANGAWAGMLLKQLGIFMPLEPAKGYSMTFDTPDNAPKIPLLLSESKVALTPLGKKFRISGTLEFSGINLKINERRTKAIFEAPAKYIPDLKLPPEIIAKAWAGFRTCTPDGMPLIGRSGRYENLLYAIGHNMIGISLSNITGKLIQQSITGSELEVSSPLISPQRFE